MTSTTIITADRQRRIDAILDGAQVRRLVGQGAVHSRLPDGRHEVIVRGHRFIGAMVEQAIDQAKAGRQQP